MTREDLLQRFSAVCKEPLPLPGSGHTASRHRRLMEIGREDLSLAKLAEAHWDAVAILAEAGRNPAPGALYAVWASEAPGAAVHLEAANGHYALHGTKNFCSGLTFVDRALVTVTLPEPRLIEVDLRASAGHFSTDLSAWSTDAFRHTDTGAITFHHASLASDCFVGEPGWYVHRPGFWHSACGPAACWAGGAAGLLDVALRSSRDDPHTLAHLAAIYAEVWALGAVLDAAGSEIDSDPANTPAAPIRALAVRHVVEQTCTGVLHRFARAYGPHPLAMNPDTARRFHELELYIRQSHAERDLESLSRLLKQP